MSGWTLLWLAWGFMFLVIEGAAIYNKKRGDTLSEHVWSWFKLRRKDGKISVLTVGFWLFWAWLTIHFLSGGSIL